MDIFEAGSEHPVRMEELSESLVKREMRGIVGFEIEIEEVEAAFKLSQNRNAADHANIVQKLRERKADSNDSEIADWMEKG